MYADRRETFVHICADTLFKFQWHIEKHRFNILVIGPRLIFMSPLRLIIFGATQKYSSKLNLFRRYKVVGRQTLFIRLLYCFYFFLNEKTLLPSKNTLISRNSISIKCNLQHKDLFKIESIKQKMEVLEITSVLLQNATI